MKKKTYSLGILAILFLMVGCGKEIDQTNESSESQTIDKVVESTTTETTKTTTETTEKETIETTEETEETSEDIKPSGVEGAWSHLKGRWESEEQQGTGYPSYLAEISDKNIAIVKPPAGQDGYLFRPKNKELGTSENSISVTTSMENMMNGEDGDDQNYLFTFSDDGHKMTISGDVFGDVGSMIFVKVESN